MGYPTTIAPLDPEVQLVLKESEAKSIQSVLIDMGGYDDLLEKISSQIKN